MDKGIYIDGKWVTPTKIAPNINPSDLSDVIGRYGLANEQQVADAVCAAKTAATKWQQVPLETKQNVLDAIGKELMDRADEIGTILSREEGKTLAEGKGEVYRSGQFFSYYAAEVLRNHGENAQSVRTGIGIHITREPVGVVGVISPWNFPIATAAWKIAPALAFGNAVIWKPAQIVPASAVALTEIIAKQTAIPAGTYNLLNGGGSIAGNALITHEDVNAVSFTGSVAIGRLVATATAARFCRSQLEMGSKNALVIMDDADIDVAVQCAINGAFGGTGQKCTASSRIIVHKNIYARIVPKLIEATKAITVGHALHKDTQMGPLVDENAYLATQRYCQEAVQQGGTIVAGGNVVSCDTKGYFHQPTLVDDTSNIWPINREELFSPIACLIPTSSYEEALDILNDTQFGLTGGIITQNLARAHHFMQHARTGCVMVNLPTAGTDYHVPFGGRGNSSYGPREQGRYARDFYTQIKTTYLAAGTPK